jgi:methenyltetrahydrofolate cyclohydrolase
VTLADSTVTDLVVALAKRQPSPGGGAAAAIAAALGCAAGAMAARYTDGPKHAAVAETAANLAVILDAAAADCLRLADADAKAYAAVRAAKASKDAAAIAETEAKAAAVPADLLAACALHAASLAAFAGDCNRWLISDVQVGVHLLAGAGRAAWRTLLVNQPTDAICAIAQTQLTALDQAEASLG